MPEFTGHKDLRSYLRIMWRWRLLFLVFVVAAPAAAYLLERGKPNVYQSSALVGINQATVNTSVISGGPGFSTTNVTAIAELVKTTPVASAASALMKPPTSPGAIVGAVSASADPATNFITITAQAERPARAAEIANAFANAISANQRASAISEIRTSIAGLQSRLAHLNSKDPSRVALLQELNQLQAALGTQGSQAAILQAASPNPSPVGPHLRRSVELGFLIGLLIAFGVVVLAEGADRRMHSPDELENMTDLPLLATIAPTAFSSGLSSTPVDEESFQMLRTSLTYFNVDHRLKSVLITSPGEKEGKTTVATRLALVAARSGRNVVLVDGDLRRAGVTAKLGLRTVTGIGAVLTEQARLEDALHPWTLEETARGSLSVLPAGPPPPNPSSLVSSDQMQQLLAQLETDYDLVIIDTPAALAVSDAVPLMKAVTGVVLVARMSRSSRETIGRLQTIIESAHGNLLGVVATGVTSGPGYEHYSQSYYSSNGSQQPRRGPWRHRRRSKREPAQPMSDVPRPAREPITTPDGGGQVS